MPLFSYLFIFLVFILFFEFSWFIILENNTQKIVIILFYLFEKHHNSEDVCDK